VETAQLLQRTQDLLAKAEPKFKQRDDKFLDPEGEAIYEGLKACDVDLLKIGAKRTHRSVEWAVDEIKHRRRSKGQ
jgi:hypothetical protein